MSGTVTLPVWLAALLVVLAAWAAVARLLVPSVRWLFRRRVDLVLEEIGKRLHLEVRPFSLTKRQVLIDRLMYDPKILEAAGARARGENIPRSAVMAEIERYAKEIVPSFNAYAYFRVGYWLARRTASVLYRVRTGFTDEEGLAAVDPRSSVVFVMNHRSNMDYILVAYLAATRAALSYAVGEWARIWPLQTLIRSLGAYFIRRDSRNPLYRLVLERYVAMATEGGVVQAIFPEGGLTRDGTLRPPKLGLLDYMTRSFDPGGERDIVFIPVGINYDRTFEDRSQILSLDRERPRKGTAFAFLTAMKFLAWNLFLMLRGRWYRFGYACVNFGRPISMKEYCREQGIDFRSLDRNERFSRVEALAERIMTAVGGVIPVLPVAIVSTVFLVREGSRMSELDLKAQAHRLLGVLSEAGAHVYIPRRDHDYAINVGLRMLTLRHIVREEEGLFAAADEHVPLLRYYANSIRHLIPDPDSLADRLPPPTGRPPSS